MKVFMTVSLMFVTMAAAACNPVGSSDSIPASPEDSREEPSLHPIRDCDELLDRLKTRAIVQVGLPYDTVVTIEQTGQLLRRVGTDAVEVQVYYPLPGTKAQELCHENGWLSGRDASAYFAGQSVLDMPGLDAPTIKRYATLLPHLVRHPKAWPTLMKLERIHLGRHSLADLAAPLLGQRWSRR